MLVVVVVTVVVRVVCVTLNASGYCVVLKARCVVESAMDDEDEPREAFAGTSAGKGT